MDKELVVVRLTRTQIDISGCGLKDLVGHVLKQIVEHALRVHGDPIGARKALRCDPRTFERVLSFGTQIEDFEGEDVIAWSAQDLAERRSLDQSRKLAKKLVVSALAELGSNYSVGKAMGVWESTIRRIRQREQVVRDRNQPAHKPSPESISRSL